MSTTFPHPQAVEAFKRSVLDGASRGYPDNAYIVGMRATFSDTMLERLVGVLMEGTTLVFVADSGAEMKIEPLRRGGIPGALDKGIGRIRVRIATREPFNPRPSSDRSVYISHEGVAQLRELVTA